MSTVQQWAVHSQTAQAAYATSLIPDDENSVRLIESAGMSQSQAERFNATWNVLSQSSPSVDGFSAVLLQDRMTGEKVLAIAGTQFPSPADLLTDAINIALLGSIVGMPQYLSLLQFYQQLISDGLLTSTEGFAVTGHSLGGFLAQSFAVIHSNVVTATYTYNSPGFLGARGQLADFFGTPGEVSSSTITNVRAMDGISVTAGLGILFGATQDVRIESGINNHSIAKLADSLAVQSLLAQLDPAVTQFTLNTVVQSATNEHQNTLESLLDSLRRMVLGPATATTPGVRDELYANLDHISESAAFQALVGSLHVSPVGSTLATDARDEFSTLLALHTLSTVVLRGSNAANQALLDATLANAYGSLYAQWQGDLGLSAGQRAAGMATFTDAWLTDRAALLNLLVQRNVADSDNAPTNVGDERRYVDLATDIEIDVGSGTQVSRIVFGDDVDDFVGGGTASDRLYGGAGSDTLYGYADDDYLEGGSDADTLTGGAGNDLLDGGAGNDAFFINAGDGHDTIRDADGGLIVIDDALLIGTATRTLNPKLPTKEAWTLEADGSEFLLTLIDGDLDAGGTLQLTSTSVGAGDSILIKNFRLNDDRFGFTLDPTNMVTSIGGETSLLEGQATALIAHLAGPAQSGDFLRFSLDQLSGSVRFVTGEEVIPLQDGYVDIPLVEGQTSVQFALLSEGNVDTDQTLNLTAAFLDANGDPIAESQSILAIAFDATTETSGESADTIYRADPQLPSGGTASGAHSSIYGWPSSVQTNHFISWEVVAWPHDNPNLYRTEVIDMSLAEPAGSDDYVTIDGGLGDSYIIGSAYNDGIQDGVNAGEGSNVLFSATIGGKDILFGGLGNDVLQTHGGDDQSYGGEGDDFLIDSPIANASQNYDDTSWVDTPGHSNRDRLYGEAGNDIIVAGAGNALLDGGAHNDELYGGAHDDTLFGGSGNDVLSGDSRQTDSLWIYFPGALLSGFDVTVYNGEQVFWTSGHMVEETIAPGNDFLDGGDGNDQLLGGGGDDVLRGGEGDDTLQGDTFLIPDGTQGFATNHGLTPMSLQGDDRLYGDAGADQLRGGAGADLLDGGTGDDYLVGDEVDEDAGDDYLTGGEGNDTLFGQGGADALVGGSGNDNLYGESSGIDGAIQGDDFLEGGAGEDVLVGGGGADTLFAGADNDQLFGDASDTPESIQGEDHLDGGDGDDTMVGGGGADTLIGAAGNDQLFGDFTTDPAAMQLGDLLDGGEGEDWLQGYGGDDTLLGGNGNDVLFGDDGNDLLDGGEGVDELQGGAGDDVLIASEAGDGLFGQGGNDTYIVSGGATIVDTEGSNTLVAAFSGPDAPWMTVSSGMATIVNGAGQSISMSQDTLQRLSYIDLGNGSSYQSGDEIIRELYRATTLGDPNGDPMHNVITLEAGVRATDIELLATEQDLVLGYAGSSAEWIDTDDLRTRGALVTMRDGALYGFASGSQALVLHNWYETQRYTYLGVFMDDSGVATNFAATAVDLTRHFAGSDHADDLVGRETNDDLRAAGGDDVVSGLEGDDLLDGGSGSDTLIGGAGNDVYVYRAGDGIDRIYDDAGTADVVRFDSSITPSEIAVTEEGSAVVFQIASSAAHGIRIEDWANGDANPIERFEFAEGTVWTPFDVESRLPGNRRPHLIAPIADQIAPLDEPFSFAFSEETFADPNESDVLTYEARLSDGSELPAWLQFDASARTFSGNPTEADGGIYELTVHATDPGGLSTITTFELWVPVPVDLTGTSGSDTLSAETSDDHRIFALSGNDTLVGGVGGDLLVGGTGNDTLQGGDGSDTYAYNVGDGSDLITDARDSIADSFDAIQFGDGISPGQVSIERVGTVFEFRIQDANLANLLAISVEGGATEYGAEILDEVRFNDGTILDRTALDAMTMTTSAGADEVVGFSADDVIDGLAGDDTLRGGSGNDDLAGGSGNDFLFGGSGDDTYRYSATDGNDLISDTQGANRLVLGPDTTPENLLLHQDSSSRRDAHTGGILTIDGLTLSTTDGPGQLHIRDYFVSSSDRPISAIEFADGTVWSQAEIEARIVMFAGSENGASGTASDDQYSIDHWEDGIGESAEGGADSVSSQVSYRLPDDVENLMLFGPLATTGVGNDLDNGLTGHSRNNTLDGGEGQDTLIGGAGDDRYYVESTAVGWRFSQGGWDNFHDTVLEAPNEGVDTLMVASYSAIIPENVEHLILVGDQNESFTATGADDLRRRFEGNSSDNVIDLSLRDNFIAQYGAYIDGGAGSDLMIGMVQPTWFVVDSAGDTVVGHSSSDTVETALDYTLGADVEHLTLTGSESIRATGNAGHNRIDGSQNTAANVLAGGLGDDEYIVGAGDLVEEMADEGIDSVSSSVSHTLNENVENLTLTGTSASSGRGNAIDNVIQGTSGNNYLVGGGGSDQLVGGIGRDTYADFTATSGLDVIVDTGGTNDRLQFDVSAEIDVEALQISRVGDDLQIAVDSQNAITVQSWYASANNVIETMSLVIDGPWYQYTRSQIESRAAGVNGAPRVNLEMFDESGMANEQLTFQIGPNHFSDLESQSSLLYSAALEDGSSLPSWLHFDPNTRTFTGTPGNSDSGTISVEVKATDAGGLSASSTFDLTIAESAIVFGTPGDDTLIGDADDNTLIGFAGNDTIEGMGGYDELHGEEGNDVIEGGFGPDFMTGWEGDDIIDGGPDPDFLLGGAGNDHLDGGAGPDVMVGQADNDTYVVDELGDEVWEMANEGIDEVRSTITYTLVAEFENLTLTGTSAIDGSGNVSDNVILGNSGNNTLSGNEGNDRLSGDNGADIYRYTTGHGSDMINNASTDAAFDRLVFTDLSSSEVTVNREGDDLLLVRTSTPTESVRVENWYIDDVYEIDSIQFTDQTLTGEQITAQLSGQAANGTAPAAASFSAVGRTARWASNVDLLFPNRRLSDDNSADRIPALLSEHFGRSRGFARSMAESAEPIAIGTKNRIGLRLRIAGADGLDRVDVAGRDSASMALALQRGESAMTRWAHSSAQLARHLSETAAAGLGGALSYESQTFDSGLDCFLLTTDTRSTTRFDTRALQSGALQDLAMLA